MKSFGNIRKLAKKSGFSMIEVMVAGTIFALATAGIFAMMNSLSAPAQQSEEDIKAAFIAKRILDELRWDVDASTWDSGNLDPTGGPFSNGEYPLADIVESGVTFSPTYIVTEDPVTGARNVDLNLTW